MFGTCLDEWDFALEILCEPALCYFCSFVEHCPRPIGGYLKLTYNINVCYLTLLLLTKTHKLYKSN